MESTPYQIRGEASFLSGLLVFCLFLLVRLPRGRGDKLRLLLVFVLRTKPGGTAGALPAGAVSKAADQPTCFLTSGSVSPDSDFGSNRSPRSSSRSVRKCIPLTTRSDLTYALSVVFPSLNVVSSLLLIAVVEGAVAGGGGGGGDDEDDDVQISNVMSLGRLDNWSGQTWKENRHNRSVSTVFGILEISRVAFTMGHKGDFSVRKLEFFFELKVVRSLYPIFDTRSSDFIENTHPFD
ncbi:hypothetical protein K0M31_011289 [Melipona bicolor]|uniref:Uncharacterized protein n=1 Tax=Melipona bicolor TaxID=60889 RepID=A0AA40GAG8_9HYME|nr:hypothetical protein K0M31_011289 [Melipona bicolor]